MLFVLGAISLCACCMELDGMIKKSDRLYKEMEDKADRKKTMKAEFWKELEATRICWTPRKRKKRAVWH